LPLISLLEWVGDTPVSPALAEQLVAVQASTLDNVCRDRPDLGLSFRKDAVAYSFMREQFLARMTGSDPGLDSVPFKVANTELLLGERTNGQGVVVVMAKTGMWTSVPIWTARHRLRQMLLFEGVPAALLNVYEKLAVECVQYMPEVKIELRDGRRITIPGSNPLKRIFQALCSGITVGFIGDIKYAKGASTSILGVPVVLVDHYAVTALRSKAKLIYLRQWTDQEFVNIDFVSIQPPSSLALAERRSWMVERFASLLEEDLTLRPHQYAYGPDSIFA
jgi:lauroyl/myristoyl acyltransferase